MKKYEENTFHVSNWLDGWQGSDNQDNCKDTAGNAFFLKQYALISVNCIWLIIR